jgi:hypothetical protein
MKFLFDLENNSTDPKDEGYIVSLVFKYYYGRLDKALKSLPRNVLPWKRLPRKTKKELSDQKKHGLNKKELKVLNNWLSRDQKNIEYSENIGNREYVVGRCQEIKKNDQIAEMKSWMTLQEQCPALRRVNFDGTHNAEYATEAPH